MQNKDRHALDAIGTDSVSPLGPHSTSLCEWIGHLRASLADGSLVKVVLGHYTGTEDGLKGIQARPVVIRNQPRLSFTYRYRTRDIVKNADTEESVERLMKAFANGFRSATLFTTGFDLTYERKAGGQDILHSSAATQKAVASLAHDHCKQRRITAPGKHYLQALGITDGNGTILKTAQGKFRQINRYVELLAPMMTAEMRNVADMGAGKGYLTFALYDYMAGAGMMPRITGVEQRADLVTQCNTIAGQSGFAGLHFTEGTIRDFDATGIDMMIALHACDTATDDALAKGIAAGAALIVVAPCCHKQIRREMARTANRHPHDFLLRHGIFLERQAEMVTDALRALILEYAGYETKVFEFISDEHTSKNIMITGRKSQKITPGNPAVLDAIREAKARFGIATHYLETLLDGTTSTPGASGRRSGNT
jgi:trans-aconitate methyltransferase